MVLLGYGSSGYMDIHAMVDAAVQAPLDAAWPVINACKVDAAARDVSTKAGYGELFVLRTGLSL